MHEKQVRVLIADSNPLFSAEITAYLKNKNFEVLPSVSDGRLVLKCIRENAADVILMDLLLEGIDGIAVLEELQNVSFHPEIFIYTTITGDFVVNLANRVGVRYFMKKPMDLAIIYNRIIGFSDACKDIAKPTVAPRTVFSEKALDLITELLQSLGIPAHIKGYYQLRSAIKHVISKGPTYDMRVTKDVYPSVALEYNSTDKRVERNIRSAIEIAWNRGNISVQHEVFGYTVKDSKGKPTNSEFIAMLADRTMMMLKKH